MFGETEGASGTTGITIFVVEDDRDVSEALCELLVDAGYTVVAAGHGAEALQRLRQTPPPAAILLDLFMPVMDGWEFLKELKKDPALACIPVIVMTAAGEHWGYPVPPRMMVRKPMDVDHLMGLVRDATEGRLGL